VAAPAMAPATMACASVSPALRAPTVQTSAVRVTAVAMGNALAVNVFVGSDSALAICPPRTIAAAAFAPETAASLPAAARVTSRLALVHAKQGYAAIGVTRMHVQPTAQAMAFAAPPRVNVCAIPAGPAQTVLRGCVSRIAERTVRASTGRASACLGTQAWRASAAAVQRAAPAGDAACSPRTTPPAVSASSGGRVCAASAGSARSAARIMAAALRRRRASATQAGRAKAAPNPRAPGAPTTRPAPDTVPVSTELASARRPTTDRHARFSDA
jgi:hypothetical protein